MKKNNISNYKKFLEEITIKGNPGVPGEGEDRPGDKSYLSDREREAKRKAGIQRGDNPMQTGSQMMNLLQRSMRFIRGKEDELETLAQDVIEEMFGDILDGVKLDIKLTSNEEVNSNTEEDDDDDDSGDMPEFQDIEDEELKNKIHKAKLGNNIIQGEAKNTKNILHSEKVKDGLEEIFGDDADEVFDLFDNITKLADKMDWLVPIDVKADMMENAPEGMAGSVKVNWEEDEDEDESKEDYASKVLNDLQNDEEPDDNDVEELSDEFSKINPVIKARGIDFPMLLHETVKGIYELIAAVSQPGEDATPKEIEDAQTIKLNVSSFGDEAEDFRTGPSIAADFRDFINKSPDADYTDNMRAYVFGKMMDESYMTSKEFLKLFRGILNETQEARNKVDSMVQEIVEELKKFDLGEILGHDDEEDETNTDNETETNNDDDYSNMSQKELQSLVDDALDSGEFEKVKQISQYLKEGKEIYLNELNRINENRYIRNRKKS